MKPSEIRRELLDQHAQLRGRMLEGRGIAERCVKGEATRDELHSVLVRVADLLRMHNQREEDLMRDVFPTLDAWGPIRAQVMVEEHIDEHKHLYEALMTTSTTAELSAAATKAMQLFDRIRGHMAREEEVFLGENVLNDEGVPPDWFGG